MQFTVKDILGHYTATMPGATVADVAFMLEDYSAEFELAEHFGVERGEVPSADELALLVARGAACKALRALPSDMPAADALRAL